MKVKQPTSNHCFVCGRANPVGLHLDFYETGPGELVSRVNIPDRYQGYPGVVHGGIIAAILDEVTGRVFMQGDANRFMVTAKLDLRYRKPVPVGQDLIVKSRAIRDNGRIAQAAGEILNLAGETLAEAEAFYVQPPQGMMPVASPEEWGWQVVPDEEKEL